ncbi:hypothetical protein EDB89DRAFT_1908958 [Lactarius sanguifluus]|nr:hypothetical protein EDB89DRAFT_1908958 [Lactarius sanguifluus]
MYQDVFEAEITTTSNIICCACNPCRRIGAVESLLSAHCRRVARSIVDSESTSSAAIAPPSCVGRVLAAAGGVRAAQSCVGGLEACCRSVVVVVVGRLRCMWLGLVGDSSAMYENGNHRAGVEKVATGHGGFPRSTTTTTNSPAYVLSQTRQRRPVTAIPTATTTQRITPATMTTTRRRRFNNGERRHDGKNGERRHDGKAAKASSNDDTIDGGRGAAITRQATAVIRMRWWGGTRAGAFKFSSVPNEYSFKTSTRVTRTNTSTRGPDGYSRHEYECQSRKLGEYSCLRVLAAASTSRVRFEVVEAMRVPFPALTHLELTAPEDNDYDPDVLDIPDGFLGGYPSDQSPLPSDEQRRGLDPPMLAVLPALTWFEFGCDFGYLEDLVAQIDAPRVEDVRIDYLMDEVQTHQLSQFIDHSNLKLAQFRRAKVTIHPDSVNIELDLPQGKCIHAKFFIQMILDDTPIVPPLLYVIHVLGQLVAMTSNVGQDLLESDEWLPLLRLFSAVEVLEVSGGLEGCIASAFEDTAEETLLPALQLLWLEGDNCNKPKRFLSSCQHSGCPVTIANTQDEFVERLNAHRGCREKVP